MKKKLDGNKITIVVGLGILAIATWFAARPPAPATIGLVSTPTSTSAAANPATLPPTTSALISSSSQKPKPAAVTIITLTSPVSGAQWTIGQTNTISWNKPSGVTGQMWLVNATTGVVVGWILQNVGAAQLYFPWDAREVFVSDTNPSGKDVMPGRYIIKMSFISPNVPPVTSAPFTIVAAQ
jgi:hypothetical protein